MIIVAHSAPMKNKRDSGVYIGYKTQQFYCTSELIKLQVQYMVKVYMQWTNSVLFYSSLYYLLCSIER